MSARIVTTYLVLERASTRTWGHKEIARLIRTSKGKPRLAAGQCAVRVSVSVPDAAFEPVLAGPSLAFAVEDVLQATTQKGTP